MRKVLGFILAALMFGGTVYAAAPGSSAIGWENGISFKTATNAFTIQGILNFQRYSPDNGDSETDIGLAGFISSPLWQNRSADLSWFGGIGYNKQGWSDDDWVALQFGLQPEYFVTDNVSVSAKWGLSLEFGDGWNWFGFQGTSLGGLAIHLYFP
jgi:hypothetical protein